MTIDIVNSKGVLEKGWLSQGVVDRVIVNTKTDTVVIRHGSAIKIEKGKGWWH